MCLNHPFSFGAMFSRKKRWQIMCLNQALLLLLLLLLLVVFCVCCFVVVWVTTTIQEQPKWRTKPLVLQCFLHSCHLRFLATERPTAQGHQKQKNIFLFQKGSFCRKKRLVSCSSSFFVFLFFLFCSNLWVPSWKAVRGPQNGPTPVQTGFRGSEILTKIVPNFLTSEMAICTKTL